MANLTNFRSETFPLSHESETWKRVKNAKGQRRDGSLSNSCLSSGKQPKEDSEKNYRDEDLKPELKEKVTLSCSPSSSVGNWNRGNGNSNQKENLEHDRDSEADSSWFNKNMLDEDYSLKKDVKKFLLGLKFVRAFGIGTPKDGFPTEHLMIRCDGDVEQCKPVMAQKYTEEILPFLDVTKIEENVEFTLLGGASSGKRIYKNNPSGYGTQSILARKKGGGDDSLVEHTPLAL